MFSRVTSVKYLHDFVLELTFSNGSKGQVDLREWIEKANPAGVFAPLRDPAYFAQVELWAEAGTIRWPIGTYWPLSYNSVQQWPFPIPKEGKGRMPPFITCLTR